MMMYESTAVSPTSWICSWDRPTNLRGHEHCSLHHTEWGWGKSLWVGTVWPKVSPSAWTTHFEPYLSTEQLCPDVCVGCQALIPSQGCAALWQVLSVGPSAPLVWNVLPSSPLPVFQKNSSPCFQAQDF